MGVKLEKHRSGSRHVCPKCGKAKEFTRYVDDDGRYLADHVGRCNREQKCGYHFPPREYFREVGHPARATSRPLERRQEALSVGSLPSVPDYIDKHHLIDAIANLETDVFVRFLLNLFPLDRASALNVIGKYMIASLKGYTIFPYIDQCFRVCKGKAIRYGSDGHREKQSSLEYLLFGPDHGFETDKRILFGEHLLLENPNTIIAITEAEKTAVIASVVYPDLVWLAAGSLSWLSTTKLGRIGRNRAVILFPDADGFDRWKTIAEESRNEGVGVTTSDFLERHATDKQKRAGVDLADVLIAEQRKKNAGQFTV